MREELVQELQAVMKEIITVSDYFYQQKQQEGYRAMEGLINRLIRVTDYIYRYKQTEELTFDEKQWMQSFSRALTAMEEKDSVLLADLLSIVIAEQLAEFLTELM